MPESDLSFSIVLYGNVVSALLVMFIMLQFHGRERDAAFLVWALAFGVGALRFAMPALSWDPGGYSGLLAQIASGSRGLLLLYGSTLLLGWRMGRALGVLSVSLIGWVVFSWLSGWPLWLRTLPVSVVVAAGFLAMGASFVYGRPGLRWQAYGLFLFASFAQAAHVLNFPFLAATGFAPWGFALSQLFHYLMAFGLLQMLLRQESRRASLAYESEEKALRRVLRSRRRVVEIQQWTDRLLAQMPDGVMVISLTGEVVSFNAAAERILGYQASDVIGQPFAALIPEHFQHGAQQTLEEFRVGSWSSGADLLAFGGLHSSGDIVPLEVSLSRLDLGDQAQIIGIFRDVSESHAQKVQLNYLAEHDVMTGLPNRRAFENRLSRLLDSRREGAVARGWLAFVDLDDFKLINDALGHGVGDQALIALATRLCAHVGDVGEIARYSGDEFVLFMPEDAEQTLTAWAERLLALVKEPVCLEGMELTLSATVGMAVYPDDADSYDALISHADMAMSDAKKQGKNRLCRFRPEMLETQRRTAHIATHLKRLNPDKELSLVFQPRMRLDGRELAGAEVLVRWTTPAGESLSPQWFIPVAEDTGQILRIGYWVIEQACQALSSWGELAEGLIFSINLSARQLFDEHLIERMESIRKHHLLAASQLELEITESSAMQDLEQAVKILERLHELGYHLSLDDFGTGYSSLSHLRRLPVDVVKIDRSFIARLDNDREDRVLVAGIIELASHLDLTVLAEGVETASQLAFLDSLDCDEVQGYLVSHPLVHDEFRDRVLKDWGSLTDQLD